MELRRKNVLLWVSKLSLPEDWNFFLPGRCLAHYARVRRA